MKQSARASIGLAITVLGCLVSSVAWAGIADSPLPVLVTGKRTLHVYSVPGVISALGLATYFSCTSTDTATMQVAVEIFGTLGGGPINDAATTSLSLGPGATVIFETLSSVGFSANMDLAISLSRGSARILSTSKKVACTAFIADRSNAPPTSMVYLTIIKKTRQKGE